MTEISIDRVVSLEKENLSLIRENGRLECEVEQLNNRVDRLTDEVASKEPAVKVKITTTAPEYNSWGNYANVSKVEYLNLSDVITNIQADLEKKELVKSRDLATKLEAAHHTIDDLTRDLDRTEDKYHASVEELREDFDIRMKKQTKEHDRITEELNEEIRNLKAGIVVEELERQYTEQLAEVRADLDELTSALYEVTGIWESQRKGYAGEVINKLENLYYKHTNAKDNENRKEQAKRDFNITSVLRGTWAQITTGRIGILINKAFRSKLVKENRSRRKSK